MVRFLLLWIAGIAITQAAEAQIDSTSVDTYTYPADEKELQSANDSSRIDLRKFSSHDVEKLKEDSELNYTETPTMAESLWDRLWRWILEFLDSLFENATETNVGRVLLYTLGFVVLMGIIMALLKVNAFQVFYSGADSGKINARVLNEDIHEMNFESLVQDAVEKRQYRLATRLLFLYALKLLSDKHLVTWDPGKTNHDYVEELKVKELKTGFNELSFYFEYAWYGNFAVTPETFQRVKGIFNEWKLKI